MTPSEEWWFEACYSRWSREFDALKKVKEEKNDGSKDWEQFHAARLAHHTAEEAKWAALKDEALKIHREQ